MITTIFTTAISFLFAGFFATASVEKPAKILVPKKLRKQLQTFEPSSVIYLAEVGKYLVASDDTTKKDSPWLFLMDQNGVVDEQPVQIQGLKKMTDMESLSRDEKGFVYVLSSLGLNKNGEEKPERNLFVKAELKSSGLSRLASVELRPLLLAKLHQSNDPVLRSMRTQYEELLDVESHFIKSGELYVGLKDPQPTPGVAVILNLGPVDDVLSGEVNANVWRTVDLRTTDGVVNRLSDLSWQGSELLALSTSEEGEGHLWRINAQSERVLDFNGLHPEAVAPKENGEVTILFDQSSKGDGLYLHVR